MRYKYWILSISYLLAALFAYAAVAKLIDFNNFQAEIRLSPLLGGFAGFLPVGVPLVEILIVVALLVPRWRLLGLYASVILMAVFIIYIALLLERQEPVSCDCGGLLEDIGLGTHLWLNIGFLLAALTGAGLYHKQNKLSPVGGFLK